MVKKCQKLIVVALFFSIIINYQVGYLADDLHNVCNSYGVQEALLVGKIVEVTSEKGIMKVEIIRLVSGTLKYKDNKISIQLKELEKLDIGDEVLLSLESVDLNEALYKIAYERACYFVQCMDNKKIKILKTLYAYDLKSFDYFDIKLQWFCNTGEILGEEDLSDTIKYYRWVGEKKELVYDKSKDKWYQDSFSSKFNAPDVIKSKMKKRVMFMAIISLVFFCGVILLYFATRRVFIRKELFDRGKNEKNRRKRL